MEFQYNRVFPDYSTTADVFRYVSDPMVDDVLNGYNGCIMAYGQTGTGKTYSMLGPGFEESKIDSKVSTNLAGHSRGIIPRIMDDIFEKSRDADVVTELSASYIEIYCETLFDLLADPVKTKPVFSMYSPSMSPRVKSAANLDPHTRLVIAESATKGLWIKNAKEVAIEDPGDVLTLMLRGNSNRIVAAMNQNKESSRSHAIFIVTIKRKFLKKGSIAVSQLYLADLAGSERVEATKVETITALLHEGARMAESKKINTSLFALGRVIHALASGGRHIAFRDSKLTRILQNSLGGNSKTTLLIHCSPSTFNKEETLSTLRFGEKTRSIKNKPTAKEQLSAEVLTSMLDKVNIEVAKQRSYILSLEKELHTALNELSAANNRNNNYHLYHSNTKSNNNYYYNSTPTSTTTTTTTTTTTSTNNDNNGEYTNNSNNNNVNYTDTSTSDKDANNTYTDNTENKLASDGNSAQPTATPHENGFDDTATNNGKTEQVDTKPSDSGDRNLPLTGNGASTPDAPEAPEAGPSTPRPKTSGGLHIVRSPSTAAVVPSTPSAQHAKKIQAFSAYESLHFMCPLTGMVFVDPVIASDGYTYEREAILKLFKWAKKSPVTRQEFTSHALIPNNTLLRQLQNIRPRLIYSQIPFMDVLPHWVALEIFSFLRARVLLNLSQVCKLYNRLANDNLLWARLETKQTKRHIDADMTPKQRYKAAYTAEHGDISKKRNTLGLKEVSSGVHLVVSRT